MLKFNSAAVWLALWMGVSPALLPAEPDEEQKAKDATIVETLLRLKVENLDTYPKAKDAVLRHLKANIGTERFLELVEKFDIRDLNDELLRLALDKPHGTLGVGAARLLLKFKDSARLKKSIDGSDQKAALAAVTVLGLVGDKRALALIEPLVTDKKRALAIRSAAVGVLGRQPSGQKKLLAMVQSKKLPADLNFSLANVLLSSNDPGIRKEAAKVLKLPETAGKEPLPPLAQLVKMKGDPAKGKIVFSTTGTCIKCHQVNDQGKEVGPNLSEIGSKLSKEAFYVSILDPNAAISHNFESVMILLDSGIIVVGIIQSQDDDTITIKTAEAIVQTIKKRQIEEGPTKQKVSLMPAGLQKLLTANQLVDVVEYMMTLKKPKEEGK